jgi:hypothetical protein
MEILTNKNISKSIKETDSVSYRVKDGKKYHNYKTVNVTVEVNKYNSKAYSIYRSNDLDSSVGMVICELRDIYGQFDRELRTSIYHDEVKFQKAIKRIQRIHNNFIQE